MSISTAPTGFEFNVTTVPLISKVLLDRVVVTPLTTNSAFSAAVCTKSTPSTPCNLKSLNNPAAPSTRFIALSEPTWLDSKVKLSENPS